MRRIDCLVRVRADDLSGLKSANRIDGDPIIRALAGYILERPAILPTSGMVRTWGCLLVSSGIFGEPETDVATPIRPRLTMATRQIGQLQPIGRLVPVERFQPEQDALPSVRPLRPVSTGHVYRIISPEARGLVRPELAQALETVLERFARQRGFTAEKPLEIHFARGFKAGSPGHGQGRAADIEAVGGTGLLQWKQEWDQALTAAEKLGDPRQRAEALAAEQARNLGYGLYKALQAHGGWRKNPGGWRVYRGVVQLFGPWTATEGPWQALQLERPTPAQRQRWMDQQWVFQAHQDHIHVAR
jgi:hypothetical protein